MQNGGRVIWITGLSGAGKSTLAAALAPKLRKAGVPVVVLDGDELRAVLGTVDAGHHGRDARLALARRYAALCKLLAAQGLTVVIATISMFAEIHASNRRELPGYFEIYLDVPLDELRRRDPKNIYRRHAAGELSDVAGLDLAVDVPADAHFVATFEPGTTADDVANRVMRRLKDGGGS